MPDFRPTRHYVREMVRYGILPPDIDRMKDPIDVYQTDQAYWRIALVSAARPGRRHGATLNRLARLRSIDR